MEIIPSNARSPGIAEWIRVTANCLGEVTSKNLKTTWTNTKTNNQILYGAWDVLWKSGGGI